MNIFQKIRERFFPTPHLIPAGTYHYQTPADAPAPYRLHLRVEPDGSGLLIINASTVLHLNQTAVEYLYYIIQNTSENDAAADISKRYRISQDEALRDFREIKDKMDTLVHTVDLDPESYLDLERVDPYSAQLSAPLRLDCALTYQTTEESSHTIAPVERVKRELLTEEWITILDKAWQAGIPHIIFTGGEPTLRPDLPDLIAYCEKLGQVTGVLTNGLRLAETEYLHQLLQSGLDHLMIVLDAHEDECWEAIRDVVTEDIFLTVHLTVTDENTAHAVQLLDKLKEIGVTSISLSASHEDLQETVKQVRQAAADQHFNLKWDLPVPYSSLHPVALELSESGQPTDGAGKAWLYVEPDGDVLPAQGVTHVLGNLLTDSWETIRSQIVA
jgi:organic radical activating enzyme